MGRPASSAAERIFFRDSITHTATTGFSTSVSVLMIWTGYLRSLSGKEPTAIHINCRTAEESFPPLYPTIQGAIDAATAADRILILPGTHTEAITVNKQLTIQSGGPATTIIDVSGLGTNAVTITANGTLFGVIESGVAKGITITGASESGILLNADNCVVKGNIITSNDTGVFVATGADANVLMYNDITGNTTSGVYDEAGSTVDATYNWWGNIST